MSVHSPVCGNCQCLQCARPVNAKPIRIEHPIPMVGWPRCQKTTVAPAEAKAGVA